MFNWLDILLIGFFVLGAVFGILQGYKWQLFRIGCIILAYVLAIFFYDKANNFLAKFLQMENRHYLGYVTIFFGTLLITFLIGVFVTKSKTNYSGGSRLVGIVLGVGKNVIFCSIIITYVWLFGTENERTPINKSVISTKLRSASLFTIYKLPQKVTEH